MAKATAVIKVRSCILTSSDINGIRSVGCAKSVVTFGQVEGAWGGAAHVALLQKTVSA